MMKMNRVSKGIWEIPVSAKDGMLVPARILSSEKLIGGIDEGVIDQITNVACLPGIQRYAICMPDAHRGYGFPIGGVAAFDLEEGVISPGGIGFDINCGMRIIRTNLKVEDLRPRQEALVNELFRNIPSGVGKTGSVSLNKKEFRSLMVKGSRWCLEREMAVESDVEFTESSGCVEGADPATISDRALNRGISQIGTLGSGNHYLELEFLAEDGLYDRDIAEIFGIGNQGQVIIAVHCGSRGFGHQIATDYLKTFNQNNSNYGIKIRDRELAAAPIKSQDGKDYYSAMACAANTAFANRQVITHHIREAFGRVFGIHWSRLGLTTVYDVAHNIARIEKYEIEGRIKELLVHRKGATRSFGPDNKDIPSAYRISGQPVIVGGSMETGSAVFAGSKIAEKEYFGSTVHGAGRVMSRTKAKKSIRGDALRDGMAQRGIMVKTGFLRGLAEEAGFAYKNIDEVSEAVNELGISHLVARYKPLAIIKG